MSGTMVMTFETFQVTRIISRFPTVESLWADIKVPTGEMSIVITGIVVIKPFEPLHGLLRQPGNMCRASISSDCATNIHNAAIITPFHYSCVTYLSELDQSVDVRIALAPGQ